MKGNVQLEITQETIVAALQMYFNSRFAEGKALRVVEVSKEQYAVNFKVKAEGEAIE